MMKLKILSWNIWTDGYFDQITDFLKKSNADIIGLQEVDAKDPKRDVIGFLTTLGYKHIFAPVKKEWGDRVISDGPALFSRHKIAKNETYVLSQEDKRAAVRADIVVGDKILHVFSTHLTHTHQKKGNEQDIQASNLIKKLPTEHTILMGDFNATPDSSVIKNLKEILVDTDPSSAPTWSVYPGGCKICNPTRLINKLDYIFASKNIKTHSFKVESSKGSDHLPISVMVEI